LDKRAFLADFPANAPAAAKAKDHDWKGGRNHGLDALPIGERKAKRRLSPACFRASGIAGHSLHGVMLCPPWIQKWQTDWREQAQKWVPNS